MIPKFSIWDMDKTLCIGDSYTPEQCLVAEPIPEYVEKAKKRYETSIVMIYTARKDHLIPATFEWLRKHDIRWHWFSNIKVPLMDGEYVDTDSVHPKDL